MSLSDEKFLTPAPVAEEPRYDFKKALAGVGDKMVRQAGDFWSDFDGVPLKAAADKPFSVGDSVEYNTPDGVRRVGSLTRPLADGEWLVQLDENSYARVPEYEVRHAEVTPKHDHRASVKEALAKTSSWSERRKPQSLSNGTIAITLDVGHETVSDDDVLAYAASKGLTALDAARDGSLLRIIARSEVDKNMPGLEAEEMPGTGGAKPILMAPSSQKAIEREFDDTTLDLDVTPEQLLKLLERDAALTGFKLGALVEDEHKVSRSFQVPHKYLRPDGKVTAELSVEAVPVSGVIERDNSTSQVRVFFHSASGVEAPYSQGDGPLGTREDAPDEQYVVKADVETEAADKKTKRYYKDYYGEYGNMLTRDIPTKKRKPMSKKKAQMVTARAIVDTLISAAESNEDLMHQLGKIVTATIGDDPKSVLDVFDATIFPRIIYGALSGNQGRKVLRLYRDMVPAKERAKPDFGQRDKFVKQPEPKAPAQQQQQQQAPAQQQQQQASTSDDDAVVMLPKFRQKPQKKDTWAPRKKANLPLAFGSQARPRLETVTAQGQYLCIKMVWDPDECEGMTDQGTKHNIISWLKGLATLKEEYPDLGFLGKPKFKTFDPDAGLAEILVRSSEGRSFPTETHEVEATDNETRS